MVKNYKFQIAKPYNKSGIKQATYILKNTLKICEEVFVKGKMICF